MNKLTRNIDIWKYDLETDILFFRDKSFKYHSSMDMGDLFIEMDEDGLPIGVELLNASTNFGVPKSVLNDIKGLKANISASESNIKVTITISVMFRNAKVQKVSISQGINDINLQPGQFAMAC